MLKIGLIGPSGSGKSALARAIKEQRPEFSIVDDYIETFQKLTDLAVAKYASYVVNMQIAMYRLGEELHEQKNSLDIITCGTMLDTCIYTAFNAAEISENDDGTFDMEVLSDSRTFASLYWFALLRQDTWKYDHVFYLPPGEEPDRLARIFDQSVDDALKTFRIDCTKLSGSLDERQAQRRDPFLRLPRTD